MKQSYVERYVEAVSFINRLLECSELNMDDMEDDTRELIEEVQVWLGDLSTRNQ